ncbi:hypothetical protein GCM10023144_38550 [Pigmentiphaga soli]|uniref:DUF1566 domain-containing protein n=1 Tax=Pigmentiphaga soli TaxID=1007095 RepID=A0ABP8HII6_9BURK
MKHASRLLLQVFLLIGLAAALYGCGGDSSDEPDSPPPPDVVALASVQADSNSPTTPPATVVATFNTKVVSLAPEFFRVSGSCTALPTGTPSIGADGKIVTVEIAGGDCAAGQTLTLTLDPEGATFDTAVSQKGAVWTRSYTIEGTSQSVGGNVTGLTGTLVLQNNGGDAQTISGDGQFVFPTLVDEGSPYAVTVQTQPAGQTCTVSHGAGTMGNTAVQDVAVVCSANVHALRGTVSGLAGQLVLQNNGVDDLSVAADGPFTFAAPVAEGGPYNVTVRTQPATQTCTVSNGSGTMGGADVQNVAVTCSTNAHTVGGTVSGLVGQVALQNNGRDNLGVGANGPFTFATPVAQGGTYNVTVLTQPATQTCTVTNGSGIMGGANVTNVDVNCSNNSTTLSVSATGTIPVNGGTGTITVTNTGTTYTAYNVAASLPSGWTAATQDTSNCIAIPPNGSCTLSFTSTKPYVAQAGIPVSGDNVSSTATTALAFSIDGNLVFAVPSPSTAMVVTSVDVSVSTPWGGFGTQTSASSLDDGMSNTNAIVATLGTGSSYAARSCQDLVAGAVPPGTWSLPGICQLAGAGAGAGCASGTANIDENLAQLGFGGFGSVGGVGSSLYWSSTEFSASPQTTAWAVNFATNAATQVGVTKQNAIATRCVRSIPY